MNLNIWPYFQKDGEWSIPENLFGGIFDSMIWHDRVVSTFYDGTVRNRQDFFRYFQTEGNYPVLVYDTDDKTIVLWAWLNNIEDKVGYAHFTFLDKFSRTAIQMVLDFWKSLGFLVIIGVTPESYGTIVKLLQHSGLTILGTIPQMCNMVYLGKREAGIISYKELSDGKEIV